MKHSEKSIKHLGSFQHSNARSKAYSRVPYVIYLFWVRFWVGL